jgi:hypothetical protein
MDTVKACMATLCFYYMYFVRYCNQTGSWHWKLIPTFMTVLLVAINHKPWNPTVISFNSLKTWCIIWPDAEVKKCTACMGCNQKQGVPKTHVSNCIYFYFSACLVLLLLLCVMFMKNLLLTDSVHENFEFSATWMLRIQVFWVVKLANRVTNYWQFEGTCLHIEGLWSHWYVKMKAHMFLWNMNSITLLPSITQKAWIPRFCMH